MFCFVLNIYRENPFLSADNGTIVMPAHVYANGDSTCILRLALIQKNNSGGAGIGENESLEACRVKL